MKDNVLEITNLNFGYHKSDLIYNNFNLLLKRGEIVSIVGASGSGKSTLFELITKNLKPNSGTIRTLKISSIYQDPYSSFHPSFTILEQLYEVASFEEEELEDLLVKVSIAKDLLLKKAHELSGGQLQRCSILRAILMKPDILLADEPTSALDNVIALDVMRLLMGFLKNFGILLITHDSDLATWCSDRIIQIDK